MFANDKDQMHKQFTEGRKYSKEKYKEQLFFLVKDSLAFFYLNTRFSNSKPGILFFIFSKKFGRSGDGKRNILLGWPNMKLRHVEITVIKQQLDFLRIRYLSIMYY